MEHFWYIEASFQESCYQVSFLALPVTFRKRLSESENTAISLVFCSQPPAFSKIMLGWNSSGVSFVLVKTDHRLRQEHRSLLVQ